MNSFQCLFILELAGDDGRRRKSREGLRSEMGIVFFESFLKVPGCDFLFEIVNRAQALLSPWVIAFYTPMSNQLWQAATRSGKSILKSSPVNWKASTGSILARTRSTLQQPEEIKVIAADRRDPNSHCIQTTVLTFPFSRLNPVAKVE
jgi:hypothetical protein